jgi:hypothetical protein
VYDFEHETVNRPTLERRLSFDSGFVDDIQVSRDSACMPRPTRVQIAQIAGLSVVIFVGIKILFALLVFAFTVATGAWTDRP